MLFSIVIPVFNGEKYLFEALQSVNSQTIHNYEVIVVDDGSTDRTRQIADSFAKSKDNVRVIHQENVGPFIARRIALKAAKGQYVVFLDADDCIHPLTLQNLANIIVESNADIVAFRYSRHVGFSISDSPSPLAPGLYVGDRFAEAKRHLCLGKFNEVWGKAIRLSCFDRETDYSAYAELMYGEDLLQLLPVFDNSRSLYSSDKVLYYYRPNDSANTAKYKSSQLFDIRKVNSCLLSYARHWGESFYRAACMGEIMQYIYILKMAASTFSYRSFIEAFSSVRMVMQEEGSIARSKKID